VMSFERAADRRVNGVASRSEQRIVRARAAAADGGDSGGEPVQPAPEKGYVNSDGLAVAPSSAPDEVRAIIDAGNRIAKKPYKYGGGHGSWNDSGYDCSGSVSYVLHAAGLLSASRPSGGFTNWAFAGHGRWVTVYANGGHAFMTVAGLRFDTTDRERDGTRWHRDIRSSAGYAVRHPGGIG